MRAAIQEKLCSGLAAARVPFGLRILSGGCGFFGDVAIALNGIRFAERHRLRCRVDWDARSLYHDPARGGNAWPRFFRRSAFDFRPPGGRPAGPTLPFFPSARDFDCYEGLDRRRSLNAALARFCEIDPQILARADAHAARHFRGPTLGVHVRMTDAAQGRESRATLSAETFIDEARLWLRERPEATVFLATDDAPVARRFAEVFGPRVHMQDCTRSSDGTSLHGHYDAGTAGDPFLKGVEVLVDALLLARCDHLLRVHSRVTWFSLCLNPGLGFTDLTVKYLGDVRMGWLQEA